MSKDENPINIASERIVTAQVELNKALENYQLIVGAFLEGVTQEHKIWIENESVSGVTHKEKNND